MIRTLAILFVLACAPALAQDASPPEAPVVQELEDGRYRLGAFVIDKAAGSVRCSARVNMDEGLLEVLLCTPRGKLHEALLVADVEPLHLQLSLLTLGLEPGSADEEGENLRLEGDPVRVFVRWDEGEGTQRVRLEELVWNVHRERVMRAVDWVFVGSRVVNETFMASVEGQMITSYRDPFTILDNPLESGSDDTTYRVHAERVPPAGTPVEIEFVDARRGRRSSP